MDLLKKQNKTKKQKKKNPKDLQQPHTALNNSTESAQIFISAKRHSQHFPSLFKESSWTGCKHLTSIKWARFGRHEYNPCLMQTIKHCSAGAAAQQAATSNLTALQTRVGHGRSLSPLESDVVALCLFRIPCNFRLYPQDLVYSLKRVHCTFTFTSDRLFHPWAEKAIIHYV